VTTPRGATQAWLDALVLREPTDDCLIDWPFARSNGRPFVSRGGNPVLAHRLVLMAVAGDGPAGTEVAHSCGNGHLGCLNPRHLRWATRSENQADRNLHGTSNRGPRNGMAKMDEATVRAIRASSESVQTLAARYDISHWNVYNIRNGKSWGWLA
jgi:hypothetical protein